jgi:hypothetical protein
MQVSAGTAPTRERVIGEKTASRESCNFTITIIDAFDYDRRMGAKAVKIPGLFSAEAELAPIDDLSFTNLTPSFLFFPLILSIKGALGLQSDERRKHFRESLQSGCYRGTR